jgi:hypothetical protein
MAVAVETEPTFRASGPEVRFESLRAAPLFGRTDRNYDVAADGTEAVMIRPYDADPTLILVQHWGQELAGLVPTR